MSFSISGGYSSVANVINGNLPTVTDLIPKAHDTFNIGSSTLRWNSLYSNNEFFGTAPSTSSDFNKKKDIQAIGDALSIVMQLKPKSFKMKNGTSNRVHTGFIAQECQDLFCPNWAAYVKDGEDIGLRYEQFISLNTRAIQQVNNRLVNVEEFSKLVSQKLDTDFSVSDTKQNEMSTIRDRLNALGGDLGNLRNELRSEVGNQVNNVKSELRSEVGNQLGNLNSVKADLSSIFSRLQFLENNLRSSLTEECICRVNDMRGRISSEIDLKLENNLHPRLTEECQTRVNNMQGRISSEVDTKIEKERENARAEARAEARAVEAVLLNFQTKFNDQICDLIDKVNLLIEKCSELESKSKLQERINLAPSQNDVISPLMESLVDKVNFLIAKCDDIESFKERFGNSLTENSREIELLLNFENTFKQEMADLVSKVDLLSNELDNFKVKKQADNELINGVLEKINLISGDVNSIREKHDESLREQSVMNTSFENSLREQMIELVEKVNLLSNDLEVIKQAVTTSSKEQKSEELELINRLIEKINMLASELQTIKESQAQNVTEFSEYKDEHKTTHSVEMELINGLMEKVNLLMADLESFRENVKQSVQESGTVNENVNFEDTFRQQMIDLIEKVNSLVIRCNDLDLKLNNIPKPKAENKIEFEDSDSCGSSMIETIQERLYKAEQLIGKQQKMITKLTNAVNSLLRASENK